MHRRDIITAGIAAATAAALAPVSTAMAAGGEKAAPEDATLNLTGLGLPVVVDGRLRNYVFVTVKLHLGAGQTVETLRAKDPYFRDALVRTAHRVPLASPDNWLRLNENAINAAVVAIADVVAGKGSVTRSEVLEQTPRRRTGMRGA